MYQLSQLWPYTRNQIKQQKIDVGIQNYNMNV